MSISQVMLVIISGLGIFHGLFLAALLWTNRTSVISNKLLSLLLIIFSIRVGKSVIMAFTGNLPITYIYLGLCLMMFIGPLFLLYCTTQLNKAQDLKRKELIHFAPGLFFSLLVLPMKQIGFENIPTAVAALLYGIFYLHFLGYAVFVKINIINKAVSSAETSSWLNILFFGLLAIWLEYVLNLFEEGIPYILGPIVYSITVYYITYLAFRYKYLSAINTVKYESSGLTREEAALLFASIEKMMQQEHLFLDPNLTLASVSKRLKVSSQKLSMAVNSQAGHNFNEYVNRYRVGHAMAILRNPAFSNLNIAAIAYDCGFNSLSTFNTSFKKNTGTTPSAYKSQIVDNQ